MKTPESADTASSTPLWAKSGAATVDAAVQAFMAGEDVVLDNALFVFDIRATAAHVRGLGRIDVLSADDVQTLCGALDALEQAYADGAFVLDARYEDGHSAIEAFLTERHGDLGKRVHTGRSRNDQVQVATRLYLKDRLHKAQAVCLDIAAALLDRADRDGALPMPGYTHLQRAVPSSVGLWLAGIAEAFLDDAALCAMTHDWLDQNPLGTAAGYGVNLPLDRAGVTADLGFARQQVNPMYVQNSRGRFALQALMALAQAMGDVRRFAWDLSLFSTAEFAFVRVPDAMSTGSSIMPNKRNPDLVELLRGAYGRVQGAMTELQAVLSLPSGYQRDVQLTKPPMMRGIGFALDALALVPDLVSGLTFNAERMRAAISGDMYATDRAIELSAAGVPFRDAYKQAADELSTFDDRKPEDSLAVRTSPGANAALGLDVMRARLTEGRTWSTVAAARPAARA